MWNNLHNLSLRANASSQKSRRYYRIQDRIVPVPPDHWRDPDTSKGGTVTATSSSFYGRVSPKPADVDECCVDDLLTLLSSADWRDRIAATAGGTDPSCRRNEDDEKSRGGSLLGRQWQIAAAAAAIAESGCRYDRTPLLLEDSSGSSCSSDDAEASAARSELLLALLEEEEDNDSVTFGGSSQDAALAAAAGAGAEQENRNSHDRGDECHIESSLASSSPAICSNRSASSSSGGEPGSDRQDKVEPKTGTDDGTKCSNTDNLPIIESAFSDVRTKYDIDRGGQLGEGLSAVVRKCKDRETGECYAIKSIVKSNVDDVEDLRREVRIMRDVSHSHIIELVDVFEDVKYLHLIMEMCTGGELFDRIIEKKKKPDEGGGGQCFSERSASVIVHGMLDAIRYCHDEKGIVHRDLKPENFLFKDDTDISDIKIIDFGLSCYHDPNDGGVMTARVGTPYYIAPEVLGGEYTESCDIWSVGVIAYILLCGNPPFHGLDDAEIFDSVRRGCVHFPSGQGWDGISLAAKDFVSSLLRKDPRSRPSAAVALHHPWIRGEGEIKDDVIKESRSTAARNRRYTPRMSMFYR